MTEARRRTNGHGKNGENGAAMVTFVTEAISQRLSVVDETNRLREAVQQGHLSERAQVELFSGQDRAVLEAMNGMLDALVTPLNVTANYIDRLSKGDIPEKITDSYNGDFDNIKQNVNRCIEALDGLTKQMARMSHEHDLGDIDVTIPLEKLEGDYRQMAQRVNDMVQSHITVENKLMACVAELGRGNFEAPLEEFPGKLQAFNRTIEQVRADLKALVADTDMLVQGATQGNFRVRAEAQSHQGDFRKIVEGINHTLDAVVEKVFWYGQILDALPFPISVTDMRMRWTFVNKAALAIIGIARRDAIGKPCAGFKWAICGTKQCGIVRLRDDQPRVEFTQQDKHCQADIFNVQNSKGEKIGHIEIMQDVTAAARRREFRNVEVANLAQRIAQLAHGDLGFGTDVQLCRRVRQRPPRAVPAD